MNKKKTSLVMFPGERERKYKENKVEFVDGCYKFLIDSSRGIYGIMPCIGCMPSSGGCPIHD